MYTIKFKIKKEQEMTVHPFEAIYNEKSEILILGSFPSVKSREERFFYAHKQNRFWKVISKVYNCRTPVEIDEKKEFLYKNKIALWDVIGECEISGSSDSSIKNVKANDFSKILQCADIKKIFVNGKTAEKYYNKYVKDIIGRKAICLPSTSPTNAAWSLDSLISKWSELIDLKR